MSHYLPSPVNQFNRLYYISGTAPIGTYGLGSRWGTAFDSANCTAAMGAVLIDAHSRGAHKTTPPGIRSHQLDQSGGIGWDDVNTALWNLFGVRLTLPQSASWTDVLGYLKEGRVVGIQGDYDQVPYSYQCQKGGTFDHAFALGDFRASDGRVLLYDPLCRNASWVPQSVIRGAAEKLALAGRTNLPLAERRGSLFVSITQTLPQYVPPPVQHWKAVVPATKAWRFYISGTKIVSPYRTAFETGGFSATCSAPARYYDLDDKLSGDSYPLVRLLSGSRAGWYIDAKYARTDP